mgnify:CR=1 FL=1
MLNKILFMKKILLFSILAGTICFTSCKSKKNKHLQQTETIEVVEVVEAEVFADAVKTDEGVKLTFSADLLFATDSYTLTDKEKDDLDNLAKLLNKKKKKNIRIDGYTDSTGTVQYNNTLSEKRANSVKDYLEKQGLESSRITAKGYGQSNPIADNKTVEGRQKNRRVEIIILN